MQVSEEQQDIINSKNSTIVVSNPGTGKTTTLSLKVIEMLKDGVRPESILCITFTDKAKKEMFDAIYDAARGILSDAEIMRVNIHTFHSFAYNYLVDAGLIPDEIMGNNMMRFSILNSLEKNHTLHYAKEYIVSTMVPKMENAIRYIKSFGITPDKIDVAKARSNLEGIHDKSSSYSLDEMSVFLEHFILAYKEYEESKGDSVDYTDMLLTLTEKFQGGKFDYVLVDEMQDMNGIEAGIVRMTAKNMFLVGDAKQAIFGFQGGSITNFERFQDTCEMKLLSTNRRSVQQILDYSKEYFLGRTQNPGLVKKELEAFTSQQTGAVPRVISTDATLSKILDTVGANQDKSVGIITRTNSQVIRISKFLDANGVAYSSTSSQATGQHAKDEILRFIKGLLSDRMEDKVLAAFTVFSPHALQEAFMLSNALKDNDFARLSGIKSWGTRMHRTDLDRIFGNTILPVCISKGFEWFATAVSVKNDVDQYLALDTPTLEGLLDFIAIGEESYVEQNRESGVTLTTVHKAKGRAFDVVIYVPSNYKKTSFVDKIIRSTLLSCGIDVQTELEEESLRVDFVAFTRAKEQLIIIVRENDAKNYHMQGISELESDGSKDAPITTQSDHRLSEAYSLFVAGRHSDAKKILEERDDWLGRFIRDYFGRVDHFSYSSLGKDPYEFLTNSIIKMPFTHAAMDFGQQVHKAMRLVLTGSTGMGEYAGDVRKAVQNGLDAIDSLKREYSGLKVDSVEKHVEVPLSSMTECDGDGMSFTGFMDAVFKHNAGYLIVDYKTDKKTGNKYSHRRQLAAYKRMLSVLTGTPEERIDTRVIFLAVRGGINTGRFELEIDKGQKDAYPKFEEKLQKVLEWRRDPEIFINELLQQNKSEPLFLAVKERLAESDHSGN